VSPHEARPRHRRIAHSPQTAAPGQPPRFVRACGSLVTSGPSEDSSGVGAVVALGAGVARNLIVKRKVSSMGCASPARKRGIQPQRKFALISAYPHLWCNDVARWWEYEESFARNQR